MYKSLRLINRIFLTLIAVINQNAFADDKNKDIDLLLMLKDLITSQSAKNSAITGIPLLFQCKTSNLNKPLTMAAGKFSRAPHSKNLSQDAIYSIGSETKSFIAVIALQLEAESYFGSKGLDSKIGDVFHNSNTKLQIPWNKEWDTITLRQLLNHTSGIPEYLGRDLSNIYLPQPYNMISANKLIALVANKPLDFKPGTSWNYSNTNYVIMGEIISQVTQSSIKQQVNDRIINPLELKHTYYVENLESSEIIPSQRNLLMSGYQHLPYQSSIKLTDVASYSFSWANAAAAIISNVIDMNKYVNALFKNKEHGGLLENHQLMELTYLVATESSSQYNAGEHIIDVEKINKTGIGEGYGLGIMKFYTTLPDGTHIKYYSHPGDAMGFHSNWIYQENKQAQAVYVINSICSGYESVNNQILISILQKISEECVSN